MAEPAEMPRFLGGHVPPDLLSTSKSGRLSFIATLALSVPPNRLFPSEVTMARHCTVCAHSSVSSINVLLVERRSARAVARDFGLSYDAVIRHARHHLLRQTALDSNAADGEDPLAELVASLRSAALRGGDPSAAREYRLALAAQAAQGHTAPPRRFVDEPEWIHLRTLILVALEPYPEPRLAVAEAIREASAVEPAAPVELGV